MRDGGYPIGAEFDRNAPYNQPTIKPIEVEVDMVVTMSIRKKILVDDYDTYEDFDDDEGKILCYDYENCNLTKQAMEQTKLPDEFSDWTLDDVQVFLT